jgi:hypothetical protein
MDATVLHGPFQFPYHAGFETRGLTTSLLYHGGLNATMPGWLAPEITENVIRVFEASRGTRLEPLFTYCLNAVGIGKKLCSDLRADLAPLQDRFKIVHVLYQGTPDSYRLWEGLGHELKAPLTLELASPEARIVASVEFCWRVNELVLVPMGPDDVVGLVIDRITKCGGPEFFLSECFLHRFTMAQHMPAIVTSSRHIVDALAGLAETMKLDVTGGAAKTREEHVTFLLFDGLLRQHVSALTSKERAERLRKLLDEESEHIDKFRERVRRTARSICTDVTSERDLKDVVDQTVEDTAPELCAIAKLDRTTVTRVGRRLTESPSLWTSVAGLLGSALATLPPIIPAAAAATVFAALGAAALASRRERAEVLAKSPWSLVYHLDGLRDEGDDSVVPSVPTE